MTSLVRPSQELYGSWADAVREFGPDPLPGSGLSGASWSADRRTFEAMMAKARLYADPSAELPAGKVRCDYYWITDPEDTVVGFLALRHELNDLLRELGGHIGYSVRPSRRREGHATRAVGLALARARELGLTRVMIACDDDNPASYGVIEGNGGVLQDVVPSHPINPKPYRRYWIEL